MSKSKVDLIKQNDPQLLKDIREVGCFFRCALAIAEIKSGVRFEPDEINSLWKECVSKGFILHRTMVRGGAPVINCAFDFINSEIKPCRYKAIEVGTSRGGAVQYYDSIPIGMRRAEFYIFKGKTAMGSAFPFHFVLVDEAGSLIFDPYTDDVISLTEVYTIHFHIKEK